MVRYDPNPKRPQPAQSSTEKMSCMRLALKQTECVGDSIDRWPVEIEQLAPGALARRDAEPLRHLLVERGQGAHRAHEDGEHGNAAILVELEEVDALQLAVADAGLEAQGDGVALVQLVCVGEVLERGGDVGQDLEDDVAALEAAEEDRAVQLDVLAQGLGGEVEVLGFDGTAEGVRLGHSFTLGLGDLPRVYDGKVAKPLEYCRRAQRPHDCADLQLPRCQGPALHRQAQRAALPG